MDVGRRVMFMYLLAVWCFADTLGVRALLPSSVQSHGAEPAVSSGDRVMGALQQVVTLPEHHDHQDLSSPDRLKQPETSIRADPVAVSDQLNSGIAEGVCPCSSPTGRRMKDGDDERWEERRKEGSEGGSSSGGGGHDSAVKDVKESEGTGSADMAADCPVCLDKMQAEAGAGEALTVSSWNGCGHRFHTACIQNLKLCPLCRRSPTGTPALVLPDSPQAFVFPDGPHARYYSQPHISDLGLRDWTMLERIVEGGAIGLIVLIGLLIAKLEVEFNVWLIHSLLRESQS